MDLEMKQAMLEASSRDAAPLIVKKLKWARDLVQEAEMFLDSLDPDCKTIWDDKLDDLYNRASDLGTDLDNLASEIEKEVQA